MRIYVESNFILELALLQEQSSSCEDILDLCEAERAQLVLPAYSLAEPYETLIRRHKQRKRMKGALDAELYQIARTSSYSDSLRGFRDLTELLLFATEDETRRLEEVRSRLIKIANVIPLDVSVLSRSREHQITYKLSPQDALIYSSILVHLQQKEYVNSCFLNRNMRDFEDDNIIKELASHNCKMLPRFDSGYQFILNQVGSE